MSRLWCLREVQTGLWIMELAFAIHKSCSRPSVTHNAGPA